ncbi:helix-turn-helix transcriptional regulator [Microbacteriaceae bacterium VKM Ac-2854]|nr:helix-turn-helix transcriptional regulator [Microbacteriaceae bacterium VKM Ac-2854]
MTIMGSSEGSMTAYEFTLGDRLRKALQVADVSTKEMAEYLGMSESSLSHWMSGRTTPKKMAVRMWALRTGAPIQWLETGNAPQPDNGPEGGGVHPLGLEPRTH